MSKREEGFTILEALVAFAILASLLVALYEASGVAVRVIADGERVRDATMLMQSKLDELRSIREPLPPAEAGTFAASDVRWKVVTHDLPSPRADGGQLRLQSVRLTVSWPRGAGTKSLFVETRHLGTPRQ